MFNEKSAEAGEARRLVSLLTLPPAACLEMLTRASKLGIADAARRRAAKGCAEIVAAILPGTVFLPADESLPLRDAYIAGYDLGTLRLARVLEA